VLKAFKKVADLLGCALDKVHLVPPLRKQRAALPAQRVSLKLHTVTRTYNDPTETGRIFKAVAGDAETMDSLLADPDSAIWTKSLAIEIGSCSIAMSNFSHAGRKVASKPSQVKPCHKVIFSNFVCLIHANKSEVHRVRMTVVGD